MKQNKLQLVSILLLIPLIAIGVYLALNPTIFRPKASEPGIRLDPSAVSTKVGGDFVVNLHMDPAGKNIVALETEVKYDPTILEIKLEDIETTVFGSYPIKSVDPVKGVIKLAAVSYSDKQIQAPITTSAIVATLPFRVRAGGPTIVTLGDRVMVDSSGAVLVPTVLSQVAVTIAAQNPVIVASSSAKPSAQPRKVINPIAAYAFTPEMVTAGQSFKVTVVSKAGKIENPGLLVDGTAYKVKEEKAGTYVWSYEGGSELSEKKIHIFQLVSGCLEKGASIDCSDAVVGFNPVAKRFEGSETNDTSSQANFDMNNDKKVSVEDVELFITFWGKRRGGDFNKDGQVNGRDLGLLLQKLPK